MKITVFDGTVEEFEAVASRLGFPETEVAHSQLNLDSIEQIDEGMIKAAYKAMLLRLPIPEGQMHVYKILSEGGRKWEEYLDLMKRNPKQIAGVHGALGKRIGSTKEILDVGLPGNIFAIMNWKDGVIGLKPDFLDTLSELGIIEVLS